MKKIFILGAGFSAAGGIPVLNSFFSEVECRKNEVDSNEEAERFHLVLRLRDLIRKKLGKEPDMESGFVYIDQQYQKEGKGKIDNNLPANEETRRHFVYVICRTFHLCWTNNGRAKLYKGIQIEQLYRNFIFRILHHNATVITFNYDLIIDNLLMKNGIIPNYAGQNSNIEFLNLANNNNYILKPKNNIKLLKVHGSLNWFKCNNCLRAYIKFDKDDNYSTKGDDYNATSGDKCNCNQQPYMDFEIVPPMQDKTFPDDPPFFSHMEDEVKNELKSAEEMTIIGYSFPSTDNNMLTFFRNELSNNNVLQRVIVINKKIDTRLKKKYELVLCENHKRKIEYYEMPFEDWMIHSLGT